MVAKIEKDIEEIRSRMDTIEANIIIVILMLMVLMVFIIL